MEENMQMEKKSLGKTEYQQFIVFYITIYLANNFGSPA